MDAAMIAGEKVQLFKGRHSVALPFSNGFVRFQEGRLQLVESSTGKGDGKVVADAPVEQVTFWQPKLLMSNGTKLDLGEGGTWTVETARNGAFALGHAKEWTEAFIEALEEAGARRVED